MFITLGIVGRAHLAVTEGNVPIPSETQGWASVDRAVPPARLSRRGFVRHATGIALAGAAGVPLFLSACGQPAAPAGGGPTTQAPAPGASGGTSKASGGSSARAALPTHVPFQGPKADLLGDDAAGVPAGYLKFPQSPVKTVAEAPGKGGEINAFTPTFQPPPTPMEQNAAWQELNKRLNATLKIPIVAVADYPTRLATITSGADLPDLLRVVHTTVSLQDLPRFLEAACAALSPYLSGDASKAYPNLANLPPYAWPGAVFNGKLFCIPAPASRPGPVLQAKGALLDSIGVKEIASIDDFTRICKQLAIPGQRYALSSYPGTPSLIWFQQVFGAPNVWRESGGKLTRDIETDEYRAAVAYMRGLWDQGLVNPDAPTMQINQIAAAWYSGKSIFWLLTARQFYITYPRATAQDPDFRPRLIAPFPHDGKNGGVSFLNSGNALLALKKTSPERVKELLGVLNFLAAPFGSEEYLLVKCGVKDVDFVFDDKGNPLPTPQGVNDLYAPWFNVASPPATTFDPNPDIVTQTYEADKACIARGLANPVDGLYSKTHGEKGVVLERKVTDGVNEIIYGRADIGTLDQIVKGWRAEGGDQIRAEYEQALQESTR
jgi:putative aldouronate transport system substrate-binding protein